MINFPVKFSSMLETELIAPSSLFPEHCVPLAYQLPHCMMVVCIISLHSSRNHLFIFYLKYPTQNEYLLTQVELHLLFTIVINVCNEKKVTNEKDCF